MTGTGVSGVTVTTRVVMISLTFTAGPGPDRGPAGRLP
jgi:hypothetical protein